MNTWKKLKKFCCNNSIKLFSCLLLVFLISGCIKSSNDYNDDSYYSPGEYRNPNQQQYNRNYYQRPYQGQQGYYQQQNRGYYPYPQGGSRTYANPYDIPASSNYNYSDSDQYYVPQRGYQNVEPSYYQKQMPSIPY